MIKELDSFKTHKFEKYLNNEIVTDGDVFGVLSKTLSRPEMIVIRGDGKRGKRDAFLERLMELTLDRAESINELIVNKAQIILFSEELYDNISKCLDKCDISKLNSDEQVWAHLNRVKLEFKRINNDLERYKAQKKRKRLSSHYLTITNSEGTSYSPDAASEHLIMYLSLTLSLLAYKFDWYQNGKIVIPSNVESGEGDIFKAGSTELLARSWKELEESSLRCLLFGGEIRLAEGDDVQDDAKEKGVKQSFHFYRNESKFELYEAISSERLKKKSFQNFLEILSTPKIKSNIATGIEDIGPLEDYKFLNEDEILACNNLDDVFCTNIFQDKSEYNRLTLSEWIRSYFILRYFSREISSGEMPPILDVNVIIDTLVGAGVSREKALIFVELASFGKDSKDLYDSPLIKMECGKYFLAYYGLVNANVSNLILSRFSSLEVEVSNKGYRFEDTVNSAISKSLSESKGFKFKRGKEEYEYDSVFILDDKLFMLECKNRSPSWSNPVKIFRSNLYLSKTAQQVMRLKNALIEYPEVVQEHFGVNINEYEIVPIILNCMPFSWGGEFEGVYVSDFSSLSRFTKSSKINMVIANQDGQSVRGLSKSDQWVGKKPSAGDLINHLENPIQLIPYVRSRKQNLGWWISNNEVAFTVTNFEIDAEKYDKEEKLLFSVLPPKKTAKRKNVNNRKSLQMKSKKRNRKK